ncbi:IS21 family transposase [Plebeiibacterium sediminum]|uniref:IS21 family transposase n=1 Tax=Plebeiibacterium sediminum TaxID=2992112 RepID=A0AAE3MAZ0_9BACT|nr:IS21 family transposase [Plebeiobacterium sediminum]MCW3789715.1 IS21 family transposase [Plebeiobacterium sediminum]
MYTKQEIIIRSYREGKSQRTISKDLKISRKTVKKYIDEYENFRQQKSDSSLSLPEYLSQPINYKLGERSKLKLTQEVQTEIDRLLSINTQKIQSGQRKQVMKKKDIYEHLQDQGLDIGYTTVCNYIREKENIPSSKETYIRQEYQPGESCEFDWGEIKLQIQSRQVRLQLAVFTSTYSNYRYAMIFQRQDTLSFMESHTSFFEFAGGVYKQMVYDNMRVAVANFVGKHEKEPTKALLRLRGHYQYSHRFCNAYRGNEKGHVERSVEYIRRKAFGLIDSFESIESAQKKLDITIQKINHTKQQLTGKTAKQMFVNEQQTLLPCPPKLSCYEEAYLKVDKYATVCYRTNRYSVPDHLVGNVVEVRIMSSQIFIYTNDTPVARHQRCYGLHQWIISIEHYLSTFKQKPGALKGSVALASCTYLKSLYNDFFNENPRDFIELLSYCQKYSIEGERLETTVKRLLDSGIKHITWEQLKALLGNKQDTGNYQPSDQTTGFAKQQLSQITALLN